VTDLFACARFRRGRFWFNCHHLLGVVVVGLCLVVAVDFVAVIHVVVVVSAHSKFYLIKFLS
jgi:hypothetical protein